MLNYQDIYQKTIIGFLIGCLSMKKNSKNKAAQELGSIGGKKRWEGITPKERSAHAKKMVEARELKRKNCITQPPI